jgi:hypothetical protein
MPTRSMTSWKTTVIAGHSRVRGYLFKSHSSTHSVSEMGWSWSYRIPNKVRPHATVSDICSADWWLCRTNRRASQQSVGRRVADGKLSCFANTSVDGLMLFKALARPGSLPRRQQERRRQICGRRGEHWRLVCWNVQSRTCKPQGPLLGLWLAILILQRASLLTRSTPDNYHWRYVPFSSHGRHGLCSDPWPRAQD